MKNLFALMASGGLAVSSFAAEVHPAPLVPGVDPIRHPSLAAPAPASNHPNPLVYNVMVQEVITKPLQSSNTFVFWVTNTAATNVTIDHVQPSCGCTVARLPKDPWPLNPGESGPITATVNFAGKSGSFTKTLTVHSTEGQQMLQMKLTVPFDPKAMERQANMNKALADKQAVFKGDCAACHVEKGKGKSGEELYVADCAICHEPEHGKAEMVSDLHNLNKKTDKAYWKYFITNGGKTLMPAFSKAQGGPLGDEEIDKLAEFLDKKFPSPAVLKPFSAK